MSKTCAGLMAFAFVSAMSGAAVAQTATQPATPLGQPQGHGRAAMMAPVTQAEFVQRRVANLRAADANQDGTVTPDEMRTLREAKRGEQRQAMFDRLDANKDGAISRAEFDAPRTQGQRAGRGPQGRMGRHMAHQGPQMRRVRAPIVIAEAERKATENFARMDANHDGALTAEERRAALQAQRMEMRQNRQERRQERHQAGPAAASPSTPVSE